MILIFLFLCSASAVVHAVDNNCSTFPPTCETTWTNVRQSVPTLCDNTCWADLESAFIRRHPTCKGVVKDSCARRLPKTCDVECRTRFAEKNGDCRGVLEGTCYEKHAVYARQGRIQHFFTAFPGCSVCHIRRSAAWAMYSLVSNDRNAFDDAFVRAYPDCETQTQKRASRRLGAGQPRYALCNITSNGDYNISSDCSITQTIVVNGGDVLRIHGIVGADGQRPAIDGGWNEVHNSNTGVQLFRVKDKATLIIRNMTLTHGEVCYTISHLHRKHPIITIEILPSNL